MIFDYITTYCRKQITVCFCSGFKKEKEEVLKELPLGRSVIIGFQKYKSYQRFMVINMGYFYFKPSNQKYHPGYQKTISQYAQNLQTVL